MDLGDVNGGIASMAGMVVVQLGAALWQSWRAREYCQHNAMPMV